MIIYKETPRLYLREFTPQDLGDLHRICAQPSILKWMPDWNVNFEMRKSWYQWVRDNYKSTNSKKIRIMLAIHHIADDKSIGMVGIGNKEEVDNEVEIAYFISDEYTKKGYGSEAVKAMIQWTFEHTELEYLMAIVDPLNLGSQKVLVNCKFKKYTTKYLTNTGESEPKPYFYYLLDAFR